MKIHIVSKVDLDVELQVAYEAKSSGGFTTTARVAAWQTSTPGKLTVPLKLQLKKDVPVSIPVSSHIHLKSNGTNLVGYNGPSSCVVPACEVCETRDPRSESRSPLLIESAGRLHCQLDSRAWSKWNERA
jgi:hypothetical protein